MKNKERIAILEAEISRLKVANRNTNERLTTIEGELGLSHPDYLSMAINLNSSEIPNSCDPIKPDFIPDWKDAPEWATHKAMDKSGIWNWFSSEPFIDNSEWMLGEIDDTYKLIPNHPPSDKDWTETLEMRPEAKQPEIIHYEYELDLIQPPLEEKLHEPDYPHLLPEGYEFCEEGEHEKFVKVELFGGVNEAPVGFTSDYIIFVGKYLPIRKIQYKATTHEIVDAVPDPYMPDWSKAPEGTVAHVFNNRDCGSMWIVKSHNAYLFKSAENQIPPDLDWKQSLRVKPN